MKMKSLMLFLAVALIGTRIAFGQVALTVSPSVISNTYTGLITLNITGLANGEKVTVQQWLDLNNNGVIDSGDLMFDAFKIADGGAMIIDGVTNISVPFDSNPSTGAITTTINFAAPLTLENIVGQRIFQVVSPTGVATATLNVTNAATGQSVTGTIYSNNVPFPNSLVVALTTSAQGNGYVGAAVADATGHYSLSLNPGSYMLMPVMPNFYFNQAVAPVVGLTSGMTATKDLYGTYGTVSISGQVYDATNAVGGAMLEVQSGSLFAVAFTDTNGNYSTLVGPNFWKIKPTKERLARRAYCISQSAIQVDVTTGPATNANIGLYKGNALFHGRITDSANNPFPNIEFDSSDSNNLYNAKGYSNPNGYYATVAYADGTNLWTANPSSSVNLALENDILNSSTVTNISPGQAIEQDFVALPITAHISGSVHDNLGNPVPGVELYAFQFYANGYSYNSLNAAADANGNYTLGVANGPWQVNFSYGGNNDLPHQGLVDLFGPYNVSVPPTNVTLNITVYTNGASVLTQPQFMPPSQFNFNVAGSVGVTYTVQVSTNLASGNWSSLYTFQITNSGPFTITDSSATNRSRFYRLLKN